MAFSSALPPVDSASSTLGAENPFQDFMQKFNDGLGKMTDGFERFTNLLSGFKLPVINVGSAANSSAPGSTQQGEAIPQQGQKSGSEAIVEALNKILAARSTSTVNNRPMTATPNGFGAISKAIAPMTNLMGGLFASAKPLQNIASNPVGAVAQTTGNLVGQAASTASDPMAIVKAPFEAFTSLISSSVGAIQQMGASIGQFVQAANPGAMMMFNQVLENAYATIGQAMLPLIQVLTTGLSQISGALLPVAQALAPIFKQLGEIIISLILPVVKIVGNLLMALTPVFKIVGDFLLNFIQSLEPLFAAISGLLVAAAQVWVSIFKAAEPLLKQFTNWIKAASETLLLFVVQCLKAANDLKSLQSIKDMLKNEDKQGATAVKAVSISANLDQFAKDEMLKAFQNSGVAGQQTPKTDNQLLLDKIDAIFPGDWAKNLVGATQSIEKTVKTIAQNKDTAKSMANDYIDSLGNSVSGAVNWIDSNFGWLMYGQGTVGNGGKEVHIGTIKR